MANAETTRTPEGGPYRRKLVVFQSGAMQRFPRLLNALYRPNARAEGVKVAAVVTDPVPPQMRYDPSHHDANAQGFCSLSERGTGTRDGGSVGGGACLRDELVGGAGGEADDSAIAGNIEINICRADMSSAISGIRILPAEIESSSQIRPKPGSGSSSGEVLRGAVAETDSLQQTAEDTNR